MRCGHGGCDRSSLWIWLLFLLGVAIEQGLQTRIDGGREGFGNGLDAMDSHLFIVVNVMVSDGIESLCLGWALQRPSRSHWPWKTKR